MIVVGQAISMVYRTSKALVFIVVFWSFATMLYAQGGEVVRVVYYPPWNVSKVPLHLALETGIFEKNGLKVALKNAGSNDNLLKAMANREGDFYVASSNHVIQNRVMGGPDLRIVANAGHLYFRLLADLSIASAADLRGKKIATAELGHTPDQLVRVILKKLGLDPEKDVTRVPYPAGSISRAKALVAGDVSAAVASSDVVFELERSGAMQKLRVLADHNTLNIYSGDGADYAVGASYLRESMNEAKRFVQSVCEGMALARQDRGKVLNVLKKIRPQADPATLNFLYTVYQETVPKQPFPKPQSVALMLDIMSHADPRVKAIPSDNLVEPALMKELERDGFCKG
jgi:NitT/TauT family transport system substrate-binding protein